MEKLLYRITIFLVLATVLLSCELLEDCKTCTLMTETLSGNEKGSSETYCGSELSIKEGEEVIIGKDTPGWKKTYYSCK